MTIATITTGDGCRIAYRFDGPEEAPILLLSNSLGTTMAMWEPQMAALIQSFRVMRYDSRGHGESGVPAGAYSMDRLGRDVVEMLDHLKVAVVDFCGLSLGGMVGQWLGVREPSRLRRLIVANSSAYMGPPSNWDARIDTALRDGMTGLAEGSIARWFTPAFPAMNPSAIRPIHEGLLATDPIGYAGCCAAIRDMDMRQIGQLITANTLVIGGTQDPATPIAESEALATTIPHTRLVTLHAAHLSNVEAPDSFSQHILDFLTVP